MAGLCGIAIMAKDDAFKSSFITRKQDLEIDKLFRACVKLKASDLHLKVDKAPMVRVDGTLRPMNREPITDEEMVRLTFPLMNERNRKIFEKDGGADFAHTLDVEGMNWRFRVNLLQQLGHVGLVARRVNSFVPDFKGLYLPPSIERLCTYDQGMVLLAGVTGSGKSTTIASMLNWINQREIGLDVIDFGIGMKHAVREDPDVMLVGEMRDPETFMTAIHAAETGHLVFGTIHASSAATTIGRILDLFPHDQHRALRSAIAFNMRGIIAQKLLKSIRPGVGRVPTCEIMIFNTNVQKAILEENDEKLPDIIRIGKHDGMQDFTMSLKQLVDEELIDREAAMEVAPNREALKMALKGIEVKDPGII